MLSIRRREKFYIAIIALYSVLAWNGRAFTSMDRLFPISSYDLFSWVPSEEMQDYQVLIDKIDGKKYVPALSVKQVGQILGVPHSVHSYILMQKLGKSIEDGQERSVEKLKTVFERRFLAGARLANYRVVRRTHRPIEVWYEREKPDYESLKEFQMRTPF